jgi:hypothetical protein
MFRNDTCSAIHPHSTCRSPFLEIEINRFEVGVDLVGRIGYDALVIAIWLRRGECGAIPSSRGCRGGGTRGDSSPHWFVAFPPADYYVAYGDGEW